ncbi:glycosyl hydrolases family 16-domain-containing protein [Sporodiniella umbellata]|nr:glycosyl hydrolases family 16-domain-containing protein [Sporodiniella umbellata]
MLTKHLLIAISSLFISATSVQAKKCANILTDFTEGHEGWKEVGGGNTGYEWTDEGLKLTLHPPEEFIRKANLSQDGLPYNKFSSPYAPNFKFKDTLQYGRITFELKTANAPGAVTAAILMSPGGDEIDFEMLGGDPKKVQTNYFYGKNIVYGVNGRNHNTEDTTQNFQTYTIDWNENRIIFSINDQQIRVVQKKDTCKKGKCAYPTEVS